MIFCMPERVSGGGGKYQGFCGRWDKWEGQHKEVVVDVPIESRHGLGVFESDSLAVVEEVAPAPVPQRLNLLRARTSIEQRGRVKVDTEWASIDLRDTHGDERPHRRVDWR
jgi:hypothetical protein